MKALNVRYVGVIPSLERTPSLTLYEAHSLLGALPFVDEIGGDE